ncbi:PACE efflux transporter [Cupriavidus pauculus]|uniref:PACE efflux transporter n=1 Tax=Cupriavidus pauculus TaxID=82633 RepID=UPI001EE2A761|nr:PACE efflux transporter [Cupriavidus pauculus]GJG93853.1 PACE efflux transporter [Cupriavidus pauculus]
MRTTADRIRHTIGFEVIGLIAFAPLASWVFGYDLHQMGIVGAVAALIAATWNYIYNILFDRAMLRFTGQLKKSTPIRVLHAILFEGGLLIVFLPSVAWYLGIGLVDAFIMDIAVAGYYMVYAFFYNWAYDVVFPIPNATPNAKANPATRDCQSAN